MKYIVQKIVGDIGVTLEDGQQLYELIFPCLLQNRAVELDFSEMNIIASPFLNAAIGRLFQEFSPEKLQYLLSFSNLNPVGEAVLTQVIEDAPRYYNDAAYRKAVNETIKEQVEQS